MNNQLKAVAESQGQWSATADALKKAYEKARLTVFVLSTTAALLAAVSSQSDGRPGSILAYVEASRYDYTVQSYRATARRLRNERDNPPADPEPGTAAWSAFVDRCEAILREENNSWMAKFSKPA